MARTQNPQPLASQKWINPDGTPTLAFFQYLSQREQLLIQNLLGPFTQAANDAAAAVAGVPVNGVYRNGNALQVRLK